MSLKFDEAIKIMHEIKELPYLGERLMDWKYHNEAVDIAISSIEKQVPKKVIHYLKDDKFETTCCGIDVTNEDYKYCPECGQLLGEVEEVNEMDE